MNQSVREEYSQTIRRSADEKYVDKNQENPVRGKQSDPMRNEQTMEALREEKKLRFFPWMNKQKQGHELNMRESSAPVWRVECVRGSKNQVNPVRGGEQQNMRPRNWRVGTCVSDEQPKSWVVELPA